MGQHQHTAVLDGHGEGGGDEAVAGGSVKRGNRAPFSQIRRPHQKCKLFLSLRKTFALQVGQTMLPLIYC